MASECPFCDRIAAKEYDERHWTGAVTFEPLNPVTPGHRLIVPFQHVESAAADARITAQAMLFAAELAAGLGEDCNLITSVGPAATQTVRHLHIHLVPRRPDDGLHLPWTGQLRQPRAYPVEGGGWGVPLAEEVRDAGRDRPGQLLDELEKADEDDD